MLSPRLVSVVDALPLREGMRVLEIGGPPGAAAEDFVLEEAEAPYDLAFAVRVGALDGRHPQAGVMVRQRVAAALVPGGRLYVDGGDPLREVPLE